jgi:lysophospholipase L1-like esterase
VLVVLGLIGVCGHAVINAGIGGLTVGGYGDIAQQIMAGTRAALVVVALGMNDSTTNPTKGFEVSYNNLIGAVRPHAQRLLLAGLTPLENRRKLNSKSGVTSDFSVP